MKFGLVPILVLLESILELFPTAFDNCLIFPIGGAEAFVLFALVDCDWVEFWAFANRLPCNDNNVAAEKSDSTRPSIVKVHIS